METEGNSSSMRNELIGVWRGLRRCLVGLLVVAQVSFAADFCTVDRAASGKASLANVSVTTDLLGHTDAHCASNFAFADRAPAFELKREVPDAVSGIAPNRMRVLLPVAGASLAHHVAARSGPPLALRFQKLRL